MTLTIYTEAQPIYIAKGTSKLKYKMYRMVSIAEAQKTVLNAIETLPSISLGLSDAVGHILGENVIAREPLPPFPASIKVRRSETIGVLHRNCHTNTALQ